MKKTGKVTSSTSFTSTQWKATWVNCADIKFYGDPRDGIEGFIGRAIISVDKNIRNTITSFHLYKAGKYDYTDAIMASILKYDPELYDPDFIDKSNFKVFKKFGIKPIKNGKIPSADKNADLYAGLRCLDESIERIIESKSMLERSRNRFLNLMSIPEIKLTFINNDKDEMMTLKFLTSRECAKDPHVEVFLSKITGRIDNTFTIPEDARECMILVKLFILGKINSMNVHRFNTMIPSEIESEIEKSNERIDD